MSVVRFRPGPPRNYLTKRHPSPDGVFVCRTKGPCVRSISGLALTSRIFTLFSHYDRHVLSRLALSRDARFKHQTRLTRSPPYTKQPDCNRSIATLKILLYSALICHELPIPMSINSIEGEILTIKQVAEYLKVTDRTIYKLAAAKKIPAFKVGGTWRFSRADIDSWIKLQSMEQPTLDRDDGSVPIDQSNDKGKK